ncbi:restriction endonuclease subunit S [Anaerostipes hadrus]|jgi:type I restriction enzyme S subunit|uniref:restriction endonuclease subunit S n=1 Tax=Lachnospiraceae TaxID=186803 RepID=UPI000E481D23|nr:MULTISPECIES: restriction endonuclease subunit S [Lachnospiraceae]MCB5653265.1 restriction endonuclease subunit S [Mediterraneibacter gnavus]NSG78795.1 restriction endonuclease subunit S [Anaerostipes hadrus]RHE69137.1 restriction endonuclease subunit S [Mediterraneibacter gnavus]
MSKLTKYKFSDLYEMSSGISSSKEQAGHGSPFISFSTVFNNYFLPEELPDLMDTSLKEQEIFSVKKDDVFITRTSETVDALAMSCVAVKDYPKATFSGFVKRLRPKTTGIVYSKYIAFFLRSKYFRKVLDCNTIMTLRASFNEDMFSFLYLYLPDYEEQVRIGDLLYKMEMKIRTNNKINDNLEQQAKLLYDYWFTQFDFPDENGEPYRSSGGKMVWNEQLKRTIPDGWTTNPLSDIFTFKSGYSFSSDLYEVSGKYKLLTIKNVQNNGINLNVDNYINVLPDNVPDYCLLKAQDILMSLTGNVGRVGIMYADNCLLNQRVALAEPVNINQRVFVYFLLKSDIIHKQYEMIANGSSQQNLSPIEAEKVIIAYNPEVATKFSTLCNEYLNTIVSNLAENQELINIRDWLLPILMNGQATISD